VTRARRIAAFCAGLAAVASVLASLVAWSDGVLWVGALVRPWIVPHLVAQAIVGGAALLLGKRLQGAVALLFAATHALDVAASLRSASEVVAAEGADVDDATVAVVNLAFFNADARAAATWLLTERADVAVVLETNDRHLGVLRETLAAYPHANVVGSRFDAGGVAVFSTAPIRDVDVFFPADSLPQLAATLDLPKGPLRLYAVHVMPPLNRSCVGAHDAAFLELGARVFEDVDAGIPTLVAGDFNAAPWSPRFVAFERASGLEHGRRGGGLLNTWPEWPLLSFVGMPVDHVAAGGGARVASLRRGPPIGSDHRGLAASVRIRR
jgi:endonuclease/exonuclease/phosphatase (EEP) superfamily protein YafD